MNNKPNQKSFKASFPASLDHLSQLREFLYSIIKGEGLNFNEEETLQILLAVDEAFTNSVKHGYSGDQTQRIDIQIKITKHNLIITVIDKGKGFTPKKLQKEDIVKHVKKLKPGGLGLYLIQNVMDKVEFSINPGKKNAIKMIKKLS
ncbi:MAG: hypothetical protein Kow00108_26640 [Calditrichia bacterium]